MKIPAHGTAYYADPTGDPFYTGTRNKHISWQKEKGTGKVMIADVHEVHSVQNVLDFAASHIDCDISAVEGPYYESGYHVEVMGYRPATDDELTRIRTYLKQQEQEASERKAQDIARAKELLRRAGETL